MNYEKKILIIGKNKRNNELLCDFLKKNSILSNGLTDLQQANEKIKNDKEIHLVLVDVSGYDRSIWNFLSILFENRVPFLVIYPPQHTQRTSPPPGSHGVLTKPLNPKVLLSLVKNLLEGE